MRATGIILSALLLSQLPVHTEPSRWFVDTNYVYQQGSALSRQFLAAKHPHFAEKLEAILPWVVRVELRHGITENGYTSNHGTGIILPGGKVVTAKHVMTKNVKDTQAQIKIVLTTPDAQVYTASVIKQGKEDWMMLQIELTPKQANMRKSPIQITSPQKNEIVVFLGYPARLGLDNSGKVQSFHKGNKKQNTPGSTPVSKLKPMMVVGFVSESNALHIAPIAGFPPVGGMSGGPVFNIKGELIAAQRSVSQTRSDATGEVLSYRVDAISSDRFKGQLEE